MSSFGMELDTPTEDLREVYSDVYFSDCDSQRLKMKPDRGCDDLRFMRDIGDDPVPWTFDEVPFRQRVLCKLGHHRGRAEPLSGEIVFYCSYCDYHSGK